MSAAPSSVGNPFPGLRPFREEEEYLFFGREAQVDAMVDKLAATHFLAVVGTSGSGKSSLVNCGLIPALHRGLMAQGGSAWRVAVLRPGNRPVTALAEALARPSVLPLQDMDDPGLTPADLVETTLRMSKLGLIDVFEQAHRDARWNLLVVVDQFEELFRYQALAQVAVPGAAASAAEDTTAFVNLLLEVCGQPGLPVYVVLTMRSDFLGECAQFFGLPEAINRGQYLVPRMTRDERRSAIAGPMGVGGGEIDPVLLTRLVNDVGDNPDQLSILQHALNRTWTRWHQEGGEGPLAIRHYEAVGTMALALSQHAEEAFATLSEGRPRALCEALFKAITDRSTEARGTRRPTRMDALCEITGATPAELTEVIDVFRDPLRSFLMPPAGTPLRPDTPIDISHESLMRVWARLRAWGDEEAQSAHTFRRLAETDDLYRAGRAGLLRQPDLRFALDWRSRQQPNVAWAQRYRAGLDTTLDFLQRSEQAFDEETRAEATRRDQQVRLEHERRRARLIKLWALPVILVLVVVTATMIYLYEDARRETAAAQKARRDTDAAMIKVETALAQARRAVGAQQVQAQVYAEATRNTPEVRNKIAQAVQGKSLVYLQIADPSQRPAAERLRSHLQKAGYMAPGVEQVAVAPSRTELRYFRTEDEKPASDLVDLLRRWNWGSLRPRLVKGLEAQSQLRQFEIWLPAPDAAEIRRLVQNLNAADKGERLAAGQALQDRSTASSRAIAETLALFRPERIEALSAEGRINALYFLSRTAPLAWDPELESTGREIVARLESRDKAGFKLGDQTKAELQRVVVILDAVKAGDASGPARN